MSKIDINKIVLEKKLYRPRYKAAYYYFRYDDVPKCITLNIGWIDYLLNGKRHEEFVTVYAHKWYQILENE
ncbi:MAG TPA: hypothetical protein VMW28_04250 [Pelolinea sp.]|nr:hypothetical protein [Pelolinea sp.]